MHGIIDLPQLPPQTSVSFSRTHLMRRQLDSFLSPSALGSLCLTAVLLLGLASQAVLGTHAQVGGSTGYAAQLEQLLAAPGAENLRLVHKHIKTDSRNPDADDSDPDWALLNLQHLHDANLGLQVLNLSSQVTSETLNKYTPQAPRAPPLT